jgi:isoprenylcysteine carboxyl methyltransferase (ICMT) family protein YpbQ
MKEGPLVPKKHDPGIEFLAIILQEFGSPHETYFLLTHTTFILLLGCINYCHLGTETLNLLILLGVLLYFSMKATGLVLNKIGSVYITT